MLARHLGMALTALCLAGSAEAQQPGARPLQAQAGGDRARLEQQIRQRFATAVRQRVGLNNDQMAKLRPIAARYEQQRRELQIEERNTRLALRQAIRNESTADTRQVDALLQRMVDIQKRRVSVLESEQRDLATVMSPLQRAKYLALQEQIRQRLELARQRRQQLLEGDSITAPVPLRPRNRRPR